MVSYSSINLVDSIIDEVALEGLDGITIEALWLRLAHRLHNSLPFPRPFMTQIWSICMLIREFSFYKLETPREPLVIFDRYQFVDPDLGIILEPETVPPDLYPHCPVNDVANGIKGSCSTYNTREDITGLVRNLSLEEVTKRYGQKLVIVASQCARNHALMGDEISPILELNVKQYCFLERVGRSRYHGEVTQGKLSLSALKEDSKSLFYIRKFLLRYKLITKQIHHQKSDNYGCNGSLLHLPRFFVERKPKMIFLAEEVIKILKSKPNYVAEYDEIKRKLQIEKALSKLFKTSFFQKVVKTDIKIPYRTLYPTASPEEWQQKNDSTKEKKIKVAQLLLPNINILEAWNKDEIQDEDESQEINISNHRYGVPYLKQANTIIEDNRIDGVCQGSLAKIMGLTKLQSRTILRNIVKTNIVATYMSDIGRQRLAKYVSKRYEKASKLSKQFEKEMHKIKELTKQITTENDSLEKTKTIIKQEENTVINDEKESVEKVVESDTVDKDDLPEKRSYTERVELQKTFYVVNRILYKYHITKRPNRYKCIFSNYLLDKINKVQIKKENSYSNNMLLQISELSKNEKTVAAYKNIKVDIKVFKSKDEEKPENEIYGFMEDIQNSEKKSVTNITYRILRRANMIMESVKKHRIIDDTTKLMKMIYEEEDKEGYDVKIDKKSLIRLLQKLAKDNLVKYIKITLSGNGKEKHLTYICDPNIDVNSTIIQSTVEQAKLKFFFMTSQKPRSSLKHTENTTKFVLNKDVDDAYKFETDQSPFQQSTIPTRSKCNSRISRKYGYSPKFLRMKALHIFLFYLVYEHPGDQTLSKAEQIQILRDNDFNITEELTEEFNTIYTKDVSWKMFVPPLPQYNGWPRGWTLMCDFLLRLPLSIFLKIHYVSFTIPEMDKYINHPIRKHYLVRDLPVDIRNSLFYARKYVFHIHETVTRLCYIGLVQFGPQKLKDKDQVFIYVNRRTELMDTTSSAPSYHVIEDKQYLIMKYNFTGIQVVEKYWYDMWNTCMNTPLGGRLVVEGKDIVLEDLNKKVDMIQSVVARSPEEAVKFDTGKVPGDRKGAAGTDSACCAYLKRNWNWGFSSFEVQQKRKQQNIVYERDLYLSKIKAKPFRFTEFSGLKTVSGPPSLSATEFKKKVQTKNNENLDQQNKYEALTSQRSTKQKSYVRRVQPRKCSSKRRTKYDEVDYRALQRMHKLRVNWKPYEDKILLVCKVAMIYFCPNPRKQVITFSTVRDVLRSYSYSSHNKTSKACQRRLLYMLRQQRNVNTVALGVEELKQNFFLKKRFGGIVNKLKEGHKSSPEYEKQVTEAFKSLVAYIAKKYYDISDVGSKEPLPVPKTVQEFNLFYKVVHPTKPFHNRGFTKDIQNINDIHSAVVNSVINSSMCCGKDRRSWTYQLFKIYQQYPDMLLRNALTKIHSDQMVTIKKNHLPNIRKHGNYMPMSSSQYQLSNTYIYKFHTKWPYALFKESYDVFYKLSNWYCHNEMNDQNKTSDNFSGVEISSITGGLIGAIHDYIVQDQIDFDIEIPDQVIMLDPRLKEKDETYFRIAKRYQDILVNLDNLKFIKEFSLQNNGAMIDLEKHDDKSFDSHTATLHYNNDVHNVDGKSDKDGFSDLDTEKNTHLQEFEGEKTNFEDPKPFTDCDEINFNTDEENGRNVIDDKQNIIKFQDEIKIVLNKDDVERLTFCDDDSIMETEEDKICTVDNPKIDNEVQARDTGESLYKLPEVENVIHVQHNPALLLESTSSKDEDRMLNIENSSSFHLDLQLNADKENKLITSERKRRRNDNEDMFDLGKPAQKKKILDCKIADVEENEEVLRRNDVILIETSNKTQNEDLREHSTNETIEINDAKSSNEQYISNNEREISLQPKKGSGNGFTLVSDILKNIPTEQSCLNSYCKIDDSDVHKRYTRIALLRMREELSELTVADSHHAHEYFVVNMFKVYYSLHRSNSQKIDKTEAFKDLSIPSDLLPLRLNAINDLIQEINKFAVYPKDGISYSDFKKNVPNNCSMDLNNMEAIFKFVCDKKELGATIQELIDEFEDTLGENLYQIVSFLTNNHLFLRSGVTTVRYIHHRYADSWLIHSYKISRLEKESLIPMPKGTIYVTESGEALNKDNDINMIEETKQNLTIPLENESSKIAGENIAEKNIQPETKDYNENKNEDSTRDTSSHSDEEYNTEMKKRMSRKRIKLLPQKDKSKAVKQLDSNNKQEIKVVIKPWIRVDGVLNRRVLDRMLGSILSYCLTHPGISLSKIQNRFVPALQPYHTRELVEILIKLRCLDKILLKEPRVTLFSKPSQIKPKIVNNDWAIDEDIFVEPTNGATLKFGIFLSTKMYSTDFIT